MSHDTIPQMSHVLREPAIGMLAAWMSTRAVAREVVASQLQTTCNHTSPGSPHPASSPAGSSETSHPDSWWNCGFAQPMNFCTNCQKPSQWSSSACSSSSPGSWTDTYNCSVNTKHVSKRHDRIVENEWENYIQNGLKRNESRKWIAGDEREIWKRWERDVKEMRESDVSGTVWVNGLVGMQCSQLWWLVVIRLSIPNGTLFHPYRTLHLTSGLWALVKRSVL